MLKSKSFQDKHRVFPKIVFGLMGKEKETHFGQIIIYQQRGTCPPILIPKQIRHNLLNYILAQGIRPNFAIFIVNHSNKKRQTAQARISIDVGDGI